MSIEAISQASKIPDIPPISKFVLIALANYANHDNEAWPKQKTLGEFCNLSRQKINEHLKALENDYKLISSHERRYKDGRNAAKKYRLDYMLAVSPRCYTDSVTTGLQQEPLLRTTLDNQRLSSLKSKSKPKNRGRKTLADPNPTPSVKYPKEGKKEVDKKTDAPAIHPSIGLGEVEAKPDNVSGKNLPLGAQLISVVDVGYREIREPYEFGGKCD